jgi:hypothetical protein
MIRVGGREIGGSESSAPGSWPLAPGSPGAASLIAVDAGRLRWGDPRRSVGRVEPVTVAGP